MMDSQNHTSGFERFVDAPWMRRVFETRLPAFANGELRIAGCEVLSVRYKSHTDAFSRAKSYIGVSYRLNICGRTNEAIRQQILYVKAFADGRSAREFAKARCQESAAAKLGIPVMHLPELDMVVWPFPNDPELPHLPWAVDAKQVAARLPFASLPAGFDRPAALQDVAVEILHYYPEERCTARYRLTVAEAALTLIGKTFKDGAGEKLYRRQRELSQILGARSDDFIVAAPLAFDRRINTLWLENVAGVPLLSQIKTGRQELWLEKIAAGLARLHSIAGLNGMAGSQLDPLCDVGNKTVKLCHAYPELAGELRAMRDQLVERASALAPRQPP